MSAARRFSSRASTLLHSSSQSSHRPSVSTTNRSLSSAGEKPDKRTGRNVTITDATTTDNASWDLADLEGIANQAIQTRRFNRAPLKPRPSSAHPPKNLPANQSSSRSRFPGLNMSIEPGLQNILKKAQPLPILSPNSFQSPVALSKQPTPPHRNKRPSTPSPPAHKSRPLHPPTDPYILSERLKTHIKRSFPKPTQADFDVAMSMVYNAPPQMATAPVWGALLTFLGREGRLDTMWRTFNDMKKRGIRPTPYTFTILLNAYAHVPNSYLPRSSRTQSAMLTPRTRDRVQLIYDQYQQYLKRSLAAASEPSETAKATSSKSRSVGGDDSKQIPRQIDIAPTNAYLKFLARYDLLEEMQQTFLQMPTEGPLAPDALTYMIMLRPLNFVKKSPDLEDSSHTPPLNVIGEKVRPLIDQALRQAARMAPVSLIDSTLAQKIILDLSTGRRADQQLSVKLIEILYDFDHHPQVRAIISRHEVDDQVVPHGLDRIQKLPITSEDAMVIMQALSTVSNSSASQVARLFLQSSHIGSLSDEFLTHSIQHLSQTGDIESVMSIFNSYQPTAPWPHSAYVNGIFAARWAQGHADFESALEILRRCIHLPPGVEHGSVDEQYQWKHPNGERVDVRGTEWKITEPYRADCKSISFFFKCALARGHKEMRQALEVLLYIGTDILFKLRYGRETPLDLLHPSTSLSTATLIKAKWQIDLAQDIIMVVERLEGKLEGDKKQQILGLKREMETLLARVKEVWASKARDLREDREQSKRMERSPGPNRRTSQEKDEMDFEDDFDDDRLEDDEGGGGDRGLAGSRGRRSYGQGS